MSKAVPSLRSFVSSARPKPVKCLQAVKIWSWWAPQQPLTRTYTSPVLSLIIHAEINDNKASLDVFPPHGFKLCCFIPDNHLELISIRIHKHNLAFLPSVDLHYQAPCDLHCRWCQCLFCKSYSSPGTVPVETNSSLRCSTWWCSLAAGISSVHTLSRKKMPGFKPPEWPLSQCRVRICGQILSPPHSSMGKFWDMFNIVS